MELGPVPSPTPDDVERWRQGPKPKIRAVLGFGIGVVLGLVVTGVEVGRQGYLLLPELLMVNLILLPNAGLIAGDRLGRPLRRGPWSWRRWRPPQFRTGGLMLVVAYVAILCGLWVGARRLSDSANRSQQKYGIAEVQVKPYRVMARKAESDAERRRANAEGLRSGKIPEGLEPAQREFLRGLEVGPKVTPKFREYRRRLVRELEETLADSYAKLAADFDGIADYNERLAAKYDRARWRPWLPVEPDPPLPTPK